MEETEKQPGKREVLGLAIDREGVWVREAGVVRLEPIPDPLPQIRREVFEAQRALVLRQTLPFGCA